MTIKPSPAIAIAVAPTANRVPLRSTLTCVSTVTVDGVMLFSVGSVETASVAVIGVNAGEATAGGEASVDGADGLLGVHALIAAAPRKSAERRRTTAHRATGVPDPSVLR